jgi:hypothetical protein
MSASVLVFGRRQQGGSQAQLTGVQKAPRHEVVGSWAPTAYFLQVSEHQRKKGIMSFADVPPTATWSRTSGIGI